MIGAIVSASLSLIMLIMVYIWNYLDGIGGDRNIFFGTGLDLSILSFLLFTIAQFVAISLDKKIINIVLATAKMILCVLLIGYLSGYTFTLNWANNNTHSGYRSTYLILSISYIFAITAGLSYLFDLGTTIYFLARKKKLSEEEK